MNASGYEIFKPPGGLKKWRYKASIPDRAPYQSTYAFVSRSYLATMPSKLDIEARIDERGRTLAARMYPGEEAKAAPPPPSSPPTNVHPVNFGKQQKGGF
jgi:hypothetical protein